ncbi:hypothetical protein [Brevundimonas diminuta]|uniref:WYL domain-containing protein n=1 Tax=Brevundimonas diminuta TaxID=293 RepID=UPI003CFEDBE7
MDSNVKNGCGCLTALAALGAAVVGGFVLGPFFWVMPLIVLLAAGAAWPSFKKHQSAIEKVEVKTFAETFKSAAPQRSEVRVPFTVTVPSLDDEEESFELGPVLTEGEGFLEFEYADVSGNVTERLISPWREHAQHLRGYCHTAAAPRTFRKDRVLRWLGGASMLRRP